jgi:long-chain acyl-CoA synthetase
MLSDEAKPWLKHWPTAVPRTIKYPSTPLHGLLEQAVQSYPGKVAVVYGEREITYAQLDCFSDQFANALLKLGIEKGDCVAIYLPNIPQFIISYFGALKTGAVVTAISPLHREREVEYQLGDSGAQTIVTLDTLYPVVVKVREKTPLKHVITTKLDERSFPDLEAGASKEKQKVKINPTEDLAVLQYTGGTTGTAKAAMLTHSNLVSNALAFAATIQGTISDVFLTALPLFHIYGMTTSMTVPISLGSKMVLLPKFEATKACEAIQHHKITVFCGVPTMYQYLLGSPDLAEYDLRSIRVCISGASSLPPRVQKRFMEVTGGFLAEGYGLTEASPVTHCSPVDAALLHVGSIGLPLPDTEAKIFDSETGTKTLTIGEMGELAVKGPQIMKGYWQKPNETAMVLHNGWLLTGDIACMDPDGYFYIIDRKKDLIKHKGYSVYPRELEDILYEHPAVKLCAVVGKPDVGAGEVPKAFVVLKDDAVVSVEELMVFVNDKVAPYKAIREIELRIELPISSAGKVLRRQLKEKLNPT